MAEKGKKQPVALIKLQIAAGKATPAPPVGPALGQHGVAIMDFCKAFNDRTRDLGETVVPVEISVFPDRSFTFITKTAPASILIKKALNLKSGSAVPNMEFVGVLSDAQLTEIAKTKMEDLNATTVEAAKSIIAGSARSMGVKIKS